jgi:probable phosphoglycerate mutase
MDLLWVRHVEPERVEAGRGVPANPPLTARGMEQARRLAEWLSYEHVDAVVSSPQRRAIETAEPIAAAHGLKVEIVEGIVEYLLQSDHYIPMEELRATDDARVHAMLEGRWEEWGGEPAGVFRARVTRAVDALIDAHLGRLVAAVCHGGVINVALAALLGLDRVLWFDPHYTSLSRMAASRKGFRSIVSLNERVRTWTHEGSRRDRGHRQPGPRHDRDDQPARAAQRRRRGDRGAARRRVPHVRQ